MKEPLWKTVLNWGAVLTFFLLPLTVFISQFTIFTDMAAQKDDLDYLKTFMTNITLLVFGLAGLRTWETIKANGKTHANSSSEVEHEQREPREPQQIERKL